MTIRQKIDKLGPFACIMFEVIKGTDAYDELATLVNIESIRPNVVEQIYSKELGATIKLLTVDGISLDVSITKQADGLLGIAAKI